VKIDAVAGDVQEDAEKAFSNTTDSFDKPNKKGAVFFSYP
jgi:hypothetical protein